MQKKLTKDDLRYIACGAAILGSGGGGDPAQELMLAQYFTESYGQAELISVNDLADEALIVPVGFMGSPQVAMEVCANGSEFDCIFELIQRHFGRKIDALVAAEIGGANSFIPLIVGSRNKIPVVDADTLGRAFPELHMSTCTLFNISCSPCFIADSFNNVCTLYENSAMDVERNGRVICAEMGSNAAVSMYMMTAKEARKALIQGSFTLARDLGRLAMQRDMESLQSRYGLSILCRGCVIDIEAKNDRGFLEGKVTVKTCDGIVDILFQNEYLLARKGSMTMAATPDIICLFEEERFIPLASESVKFGMHVLVAALPSPDIWKTKQGLALVGPQAFGYNL